MHLYIGLMSGTSVDGIDAALVAIDDAQHLSLLGTHEHSIPDEVRTAIQALMVPSANELDREGELDMQLGGLFAAAANELLRVCGKRAAEIRAIGSHGQTLRHRPRTTHPYTRQIGNPSVIAEHTSITTVADFRARDMAAGGQGAPLVPAFHNSLFRREGIDRAIINIGGIANVTWLPGKHHEPVVGFDIGPGNTLLDQWIARHTGASHDQNGAWAAGGSVREELLANLLVDDYFSQSPPKSTGREYFHLDWLQARLHGVESPRDVQASLAELTARSIGEALVRLLPRPPQEVYVCGGGAHNRDLMARLERLLGNATLATTAALDIDPNWVEAVAFAWLAHQTLSGHPGNLPSVTGAQRAVVLGGIYLA